MKKDALDELFGRLQGGFDIEEPKTGHQERFLEKLSRSKGVVAMRPKKTSWWKALSIAASLLLLCALGLKWFVEGPSIDQQVVEIAPEISETQFYFAGLIEEQVQELKNAKSPETAQMVDDALKQLDKLEADYTQLERDLVNGGNSKIILNAMIINFQTRIDLLKEVLTNIEEVKNLKPYNDENFTI
ncbi:hypothetical protein [Flagellimonas lutaonensis]|uniref:Anti-sigma factor n=1 Tax=Flagellimonas lutaonensis TaxID=516051 RepID=A0A0D5YNV4_9FLAO|nr:hypothetical protein [Allomuricauda lutaonensis]AKA34010.1 hypothetical protein VC82_326 [Allomuricauda lutaonensis]